MDIKSGYGYPASSLSNFSPHDFIYDDVPCNSMEGFLQSLKFSSIEMQQYVCLLVGIKAKMKGKNKNWWRKQTLYWKGKEIDRHSQEYQDLIDGAYDALATNESFRRALLATGNANITHSIGKSKASHTVLTEREFCSRLMRLREEIRSGRR